MRVEGKNALKRMHRRAWRWVYNRYNRIMIGIQPLQIDIEREEDGRFLVSVPDLPGVMAYDATRDGAIRKVKLIALQVLADMIESGEDVPPPLKFLFAA
jgi:predicted RNase H-like HicB family nuclease